MEPKLIGDSSDSASASDAAKLSRLKTFFFFAMLNQ